MRDHEGYVGPLLFSVYTAIPFLMELRIVLGWITTGAFLASRFVLDCRFVLASRFVSGCGPARVRVRVRRSCSFLLLSSHPPTLPLSCSETTLSFYDWLRAEMLYMNLFLVKVRTAKLKREGRAYGQKQVRAGVDAAQRARSSTRLTHLSVVLSASVGVECPLLPFLRSSCTTFDPHPHAPPPYFRPAASLPLSNVRRGW